MSQLDLIIPGLLGPFDAEIPGYVHQQLKQPEFAGLNRALSRAQMEQVEAADFFSSLQHCILPGSELSLCQVTAQFASVDPGESFLYRADPVHFKAESDHAILLGPELLDVTQDEARQLVEAFNLHFAEEQIELIHDDHGHWYLKRPQPLALEFHPLDYALGRDIKHFMPYGDDALWWRRIVNEAQMLFFAHPVNAQREQNAQLTINGLWLWDQRPANPDDLIQGDAKQYQGIVSDHPLAMAMAALANIQVEAAESTQLAQRLVVMDELNAAVSYGDITAWLEALPSLASRFQGYMQSLKAGQVQQINIYPCDGRVFHVRRIQHYQIWKPVHTLDHFFQDHFISGEQPE